MKANSIRGSECSVLYCLSGADGIKPNKITPLWSLMAGKINTVWIYLMTIKSKLLREFPRELVYPFPSTAHKKLAPRVPECVCEINMKQKSI